MLVFLVLSNLKGLICFVDQYRIIRDENRVKKLYEQKVEESDKELLSWDKVQESLAYNGAIYKFLIIRQVFATLPFDFLIIYLNVPAYLWYMYTRVVDSWGMCDKDWTDSGSADTYNL